VGDGHVQVHREHRARPGPRRGRLEGPVSRLLPRARRADGRRHRSRPGGWQDRGGLRVRSRAAQPGWHPPHDLRHAAPAPLTSGYDPRAGSRRQGVCGIRAAFACAAMLVSAAASAHGKDMFVSPSAGEALSPGAIVEVSWEPICRVAGTPQIDEAEIVLSLDGGRTFPMRVSPELKPCTSKYL